MLPSNVLSELFLSKLTSIILLLRLLVVVVMGPIRVLAIGVAMLGGARLLHFRSFATLVVLLASLGARQDLVGFVDLFKGFFVAFADIGMILLGEFFE